ncbi:MAG: cysteine--tRNA ligase [Trueperaceae bacterium]|nr:cysteine--tRNA ligase [Trueperaceae bacterium]
MALQLYNSKTRQKELFKPITEGHVGIYKCGPTVYSDPHLGHARGPIIMDTLKRWLEHSGYSVRLVENVTDVGHLTDDGDAGEDKLQKRAKLEKLEPMEIAEKYFWAYFDAMAALGVQRPDIIPKASGHIPEQIEMTEELIKLGYAYERDGSVYFDVSAWEDYGELSGRNPNDLVEGTRVEVRSDKDDPRDFALWKRAEPEHIMRWNSPWGEGFPGWHIECSVMSTKYLGDEFDIHGGGLDLIFPHHECEIAQARAAGKDFARYWLHWNMITLGGEKMAKSKNHFVTLEDLFKQFDPLVIRFHLLRSHYRSISDFSEESVQSSAQGLKRLLDTYQEVKRLSSGDAADSDAFAALRQAFGDAMDDDLNTPQAIAVLFDATREINTRLSQKPDGPYLNAATMFYEDYLGKIFGVLAANPETAKGDMLDGLLELLINQRQEARLKRDFKTSDAIRDSLAGLGITLEDTTEGSRWKLN